MKITPNVVSLERGMVSSLRHSLADVAMEDGNTEAAVAFGRYNNTQLVRTAVEWAIASAPQLYNTITKED